MLNNFLFYFIIFIIICKKLFDPMNKLLIKQLQKLGLAEKEAKLYVFLVASKPLSPLEISNKTNLNRTTIYRLVEKLKNKNLLDETETSWGKKIKIKPFENLLEKINKKEEKIQLQKQLFPKVLSTVSKLTFNPEFDFEIKNYKKTSGLRQIYWNMLKAKKEILIFGYKTRNESIGKKFAEKTRIEQIRKKIYTYEIENPQKDESYTDIRQWNKFYKSVQIPESILKIRQQIIIYNDIIAIINFRENDKIGIEIKNSSLAETFKQIFWKYWG